MGTGVTSRLAENCIRWKKKKLWLWSHRGYQRHSLAGASSSTQTKCHLRDIHPRDMSVLGDRAIQIQFHYFNTFRARPHQPQQEKHPQYLKSSSHNPSLITHASNAPQINVTHCQGGHLSGSEQVHGFVHTEARREPLLMSRIQATDSPNFTPIWSGADLAGKKKKQPKHVLLKNYLRWRIKQSLWKIRELITHY